MAFIRDRRPECGWWALAFWWAGIGILLLALRGVLPAWLALSVGNMLVLACLGAFLVGLERFDGARPHYGRAALPALIWLALYSGSATFREDVNLRIITASLMLSVVSLLVARRAWHQPGDTKSMVRRLLAIFFAGHGLAHLGRIPLTLYVPAQIDGGAQIVSVWFAIYSFELYVHSLFTAFAIFALMRERVEAEFRRAAEIDGLTQAHSRRAFLRVFETALAETRGGGSLALLDLDRFKLINDGFGHPAGDEALRHFSAIIQGRIGPGMCFGRIGGEEFALWLPQMPEREAEQFCDALRAQVAARPVPLPGHTLALTVSVGVCGAIPRGADVDAAMAIADQALYLSKNNGRNRVTMTPFAAGPARAAELLAAGLGDARIETARQAG